MTVFPVRSASKSILGLGALALFLGGATPLFSQEAGVPAAPPWHKHSSDPRFQGGYLFWFTLDETPQQLIEKLGQPAQVMEMGADLLIWQFQIDVVDKHEFSHVVCIRKKDSKVVSVARNYEVPENVEGLFPPNLTEVHRWFQDGKPGFGVRLRRLGNGRLLLAMGSEKPGQPTSQILLIRESELKIFMPWLERSLQEKPAAAE